MTARNGPVVYIACAYSGDVEGNTKKACKYGRHAIAEGAIPINPILNLTGVLDENSDRETALAIDLSLLRKADALWVFGKPTPGMKLEIKEAENLGIDIRYYPGIKEDV